MLTNGTPWPVWCHRGINPPARPPAPLSSVSVPGLDASAGGTAVTVPWACSFVFSCRSSVGSHFGFSDHISLIQRFDPPKSALGAFWASLCRQVSAGWGSGADRLIALWFGVNLSLLCVLVVWTSQNRSDGITLACQLVADGFLRKSAADISVPAMCHMVVVNQAEVWRWGAVIFRIWCLVWDNTPTPGGSEVSLRLLFWRSSCCFVLHVYYF